MRKNIFLLFLVLNFLLLSGEQYILEFPGISDIQAIKSPIKVFDAYNMVVLNGDFETLRKLYPEARIFEDKKLKAVYNPNDTYFAEQWNLQPDHYALSALLDRGITGSSGIIIGILDTGIAYEHFAFSPDDANRVYSSTGSFEQYADFGPINFVNGYDFVSDDAHANDMNGHGTSCCGIIASGINNSVDLAGIVYDASIMPVRVLDENGEGSMSDIMSGVDFAVQNGCNVLNLSLAGAPGDSLGWYPLHVSISNAVSNDVMVICATGNEGVGELSYPAAFPEAVAVGAVDYYKNIATYSQYGENMDFVAPGGSVYQDINGDGYPDGGIIVPSFSMVGSDIDVGSFSLYYGEGTSYAAPHISAIAALLYSLGFTDPYDVESILRQSCQDLGDPGYDNVYGWGYPDPNIIFNIPLSVKYITYDNPGNMMDIAAIPLKSGIAVDSACIAWNDEREKVALTENSGNYCISLNGFRTGIYRVVFYINSADGIDSLMKELAVKSPFDNTAYIYNGDYRIFFAGQKGAVAVEDNMFRTIHTDDNVYVQWIDDYDYSFSCDFRGRTSFNYYRDGYPTLNISHKGIYTMKNIEKTEKREYQSENIFLAKNSFEFTQDSGILLDCTGRVLKNIYRGIIDMNTYPSGIYYIRTGNSIWKIVKSL